MHQDVNFPVQRSLGPPCSLSATHSKVSVNEPNLLRCRIAVLSRELRAPGFQAVLAQTEFRLVVI